MTNTQTSLNYEIIEQLFQNSVCLTYNPLEPTSAWQYARELQRNFEKKHNLKYSCIRSKFAKMRQGQYNARFHYFADGTLVHCAEPQSFSENEMYRHGSEDLERIMTALKIRNYPVNKIYGPQNQMDVFYYSDFLRYISTQSLLKYSYTEDLYVEPLPNKEDFVRDCYANGNILLTASKDELLPPHCREFMALFADGRYYISEEYRNHLGAKNYSKISRFDADYLLHYCVMAEEYIPQDYLNALYKEAEKYEWFASITDTASKLQKHMNTDDLIKMNKYIDNLFLKRTCLTVVNPDIGSSFMSPDFQQYAVFSDGLVVAVYNNENDKPFVKSLKKYFPDLNFRFEKISKEYLEQLYRRLPEFQKGATTIYIEMLKQKARKLKRMTDLTHIEALDVVANIAGWQNWRAIKIEDEAHARELIDAEKWRKNMAAEFNAENPLAEEYRRYLKHRQ
ncbi:MAG: hypothetical protein IJ677_07240 [Alphaproteobacteria bacterium]|nr:hypothetical protein [Alphaproteobacteria bacterium]